MQTQGRKIILLIDGFSAHYIAFKPRNIRMEFFEANLTAHVQPLDAGAIRCFKARYRRQYCSRAIDLDEAGEEDIYKINLLESIKMAQHAWHKVSGETLANCWRHTQIFG